MKLLIVEDEKRLCQTIAKHLKAEGYTIDTCYNGSDAIDYIEGNLSEKLNLELVAEAVHYSKYYLHRIFTQTLQF